MDMSTAVSFQDIDQLLASPGLQCLAQRRVYEASYEAISTLYKLLDEIFFLHHVERFLEGGQWFGDANVVARTPAQAALWIAQGQAEVFVDPASVGLV